MRQLCWHQLLLIGVASLVFLTNLGDAQLFDEDEPKNAACAAEMMQRGDWIEPRFNGELRTDKPILLYWFMLTAYQVLGVSEFSARIWSALAGIGTVLLTYHIGRRIFRPEAGLWGGLLLCCSLMFTVASRAATPDAVLIFFVTLSFWFFVAGSFPRPEDRGEILGLPTRKRTYVLMYATMGVAVLAKGPIGVLLPTCVIGAYLLSLNAVPRPQIEVGSRAERLVMAAATWLVRTFWPKRIVAFAWQLRPLTALAVVSAVALPWYFAVGLQTDGEWLEGFLLKHNVGRYLGAMEGHSGPPMYHVMSIVVGFFPASLLLMPALFFAGRQIRSGQTQDGAAQCDSAGFVFLLSWVAIFVLFFSFAGTKLPNYVTPTHPALALLTGALLCRWSEDPGVVSIAWQRFMMIVLGIVGVGILGGLSWAGNEFLGGEAIVGIVGAFLLVASLVCLWFIRQRQTRLASIAFVAFSIAFLASGFGWVTTRIAPHQNGGRIAESIQAHSTGQATIASYRAFRPSWVFYARQPVQVMKQPEEVSRFFGTNPDAFVITDARVYGEIESILPHDVGVIFSQRRFLKHGQLLVLGRSGAVSTGDAASTVTHTTWRASFERHR